MGDFQLRINDTNHEIQLPDDQIARLLLVNEDNEVSHQPIVITRASRTVHGQYGRHFGL